MFINSHARHERMIRFIERLFSDLEHLHSAPLDDAVREGWRNALRGIFLSCRRFSRRRIYAPSLALRKVDGDVFKAERASIGF